MHKKLTRSGQFHQRFTRTFFVQKFVQSQNVTRKKAFVRKICMFNVDKIDQRTLKLLRMLQFGQV